MIDLVFGSAGQSPAETSLRETLMSANYDGTLYFAYPLFSDVDGQVSADALLVTRQHGLVIFDLTAPPKGLMSPDDWMEKLSERQDEIYRNITSKLYENKNLVHRKKLLVEPGIVTYLFDDPGTKHPDTIVATPQSLVGIIDNFLPLDESNERSLNASIQRVTTIKPKEKRLNVVRSNSRGWVLKQIEEGIANLDSWQKRSAIAYPEGPQRIRGLAGSGKTIVLALKAAYLHAKHPDWDIVVTYYSRSLKQQFTDLIRRFMFETRKDEPDWSKLLIQHCWGSNSEPGFYSDSAKAFGVEPVTWGAADRKYGRESFDGVCGELLGAIAGSKTARQRFDAVLIDEAQDLPASFFRIAYAMTKDPKRIVWAYDELQNLGEYSMTSPEVLFGEDNRGAPLVSLRNEDSRPPQDIVLPVCYRNTPWALSTAHGLGFGVTREAGTNQDSPLVQIFDEPGLWEDIGYETVRGNLALGDRVTLRRRPDCSPSFIKT